MQISSTKPEPQPEMGVPIPSPTNSKYKFEEYAVGESRLYPYIDGDEKALFANRVYSAANAIAKRCDMKFTTRKLGTGVRVWRVE